MTSLMSTLREGQERRCIGSFLSAARKWLAPGLSQQSPRDGFEHRRGIRTLPNDQ